MADGDEHWIYHDRNHQWELGDHNSFKQDTHGRGDVRRLRNLNHLRKLFDLEPVANTWQA